MHLRKICWLALVWPFMAMAEDASDMFGGGEPKPKPALLFESATAQSDQGFVEMAHRGAEQSRKELGIKFTQTTLGAADDREKKITEIAESGAPLLIAIGFENVLPVEKLAPLYPRTHFVVIDGWVSGNLPNVQSVVFKDQEGAFLVGMIAGYTTHTNTIGFVGGMDVPLIRNFASGFLQGARYVNKSVHLVQAMIGTTREAWNQPAAAASLARLQFSQGADIVFTAAGGSSVGVLEAAHAQHKYAIGIDSNQNGLYPGTVLTSLVKRVDLAVFDALQAWQEGRWRPGTVYLSAADGYLDYAVDRHNRNLVSKKEIDSLETVKDLMLRGTLQVKPYAEGQ